MVEADRRIDPDQEILGLVGAVERHDEALDLDLLAGQGLDLRGRRQLVGAVLPVERHTACVASRTSIAVADTS